MLPPELSCSSHTPRKSEVEKLNTESNQIKEASAAIAKQGGITKIVGTDEEVSTNHEQRMLFPRMGQEPDDTAKFRCCAMIIALTESSELPGSLYPICDVG